MDRCKSALPASSAPIALPQQQLAAELLRAANYVLPAMAEHLQHHVRPAT
jgi:hypothetical protein